MQTPHTQAKITVVITKVYDIIPEFYPGCMTLEEMLAIDLSAIEEHFDLFLSGADIEKRGEVL
jgi:hypothetical protein